MPRPKAPQQGSEETTPQDPYGGRTVSQVLRNQGLLEARCRVRILVSSARPCITVADDLSPCRRTSFSSRWTRSSSRSTGRSVSLMTLLSTPRTTRSTTKSTTFSESPRRMAWFSAQTQDQNGLVFKVKVTVKVQIFNGSLHVLYIYFFIIFLFFIITDFSATKLDELMFYY